METSADVPGPSNKKPSDPKDKAETKKSSENLSLPFAQIKRIVASHLASDAKLNINKEATFAFSGEQIWSVAWRI